MASGGLPIQYTMVLEAGNDSKILTAKLGQIYAQGGPFPTKILAVFPQGLEAELPAGIPVFPPETEITAVSGLSAPWLNRLTTPFLAYLPANAPYSRPVWDGLEKIGTGAPGIRPWVPVEPLGKTDWLKQVYADLGWIGTTAVFKSGEALSFLGLERLSRKSKSYPAYFSASADRETEAGKVSLKKVSLSPRSRVLALVPYFNCEPWLEQCLDSLVNQTRPPQAIAVVDDASARPPREIVEKFDGVTLLRSSENVGPYRLLQSAIGQTQFDAYLFQDADDWSSRDRLEKLLEEGERTGAEWIGTQELMILENSIYAIRYPLNLDSLRQNPLSHPFCYPSSLISKDFLTRLGGFASGLKFGGDLELVNRAIWTGKVANLDRYCYFRRVRKDSLTTSPATGLGSPARREIGLRIAARKEENKILVSKGRIPHLEPLSIAEPVVLERLMGPVL